LVTARKF